MTTTDIHIINHTHWDREWFLTAAYTSHWLATLVDRLTEIAASNPEFHFLLDGQTLVIEDLLSIAPQYEAPVRRLIAGGNLTIGPYYCQPDWQLTSGELLLRNLQFGQTDLAAFGGAMRTGWMVDTFGHISQSPQIHRLFDIGALFVWRGVPRLEPYFWWQGADGSRLLTIDLFGGYRNLYGITHAPEVALTRLQAEVAKLRPFYPTADIPLFDGYDLEDNPEDPLQFYATLEMDADLRLLESSPTLFAAAVDALPLSLPTIAGELNSGKFGATFPGTFSARTYLKIMARDAERRLFQLAEPLAALAAMRGASYDSAVYERCARLLLQNAVHDCICGVSIDQVHEKMEDIYRRVEAELAADCERSLAAICHDFAPGTYAVSTSPAPYAGWEVVGDRVYAVETGGVGVWPVGAHRPVTHAADGATASLPWATDRVTVADDGTVHVAGLELGRLVLYAEHGDTYSGERGDRLAVLKPAQPPRLVSWSEVHAVYQFECTYRQDQREITAQVRITLDDSPLVRWQIDLDSRGTDFCLDLEFATPGGKVHAGMPFDVVTRPAVDRDLLPREAEPELANVLLGQREINVVDTFPFHGFVAVAGGEQTVVVFARGLRSYTADDHRKVALTLRRSVEWLTRAELSDRVGDAGPFFYVPDARCERWVRHEVAVAVGDFDPDSLALQTLNAGYQNPPTLVTCAGAGERTSWPVLTEALPLSSLCVVGDAVQARFFNPTTRTQSFSQAYRRVDGGDRPVAEVRSLAAKEISTVRLSDVLVNGDIVPAPVTLLAQQSSRVAANAGAPDPARLAEMEEKVARLAVEVNDVAAAIPAAEGHKQLRLQHRYYMLKREQLEYELSLLLNRLKPAAGLQPTHAYLYGTDPAVAEIGLALNKMRIKRRIFDYVVAALPQV